MRSLWLVSTVSLLALGATLGCGSDDDDGGTPSGGRTGSGGQSAAQGGRTMGGTQGSGGSAHSGGNASGGSKQSGGSSSGGQSAGAGGQDNTGGTAGSGLSDSDPISDLTPDQFSSLCGEIDFSSYDAQLREFVCRATALSFAGSATTDQELRTSCQTLYNVCKQGGMTATKCEQPDASCTATVGEARACRDDFPTLIMQANDLYPECKDATLADLERLQNEPQPDSAACNTFQEKCPSLGPSI